MILVDNEIIERVKEQRLIEDFKEENLQSASYDITITNTIRRFIDNFKVIRLSSKYDFENIYEEINISNGYNLRPNETIFVQLNEYLNIPEDLCAHLRPRSTFVTLGLILSFQHINPTYSGRLSLSIFNSSPFVVEIKPNIKIGQLVFEKLSGIPRKSNLYKYKSDSKYQGEDEFIGSKAYTEVDEEVKEEVKKVHSRLLKMFSEYNKVVDSNIEKDILDKSNKKEK